MNDYGLRELLAYHQAAWVGYYCHRKSDRSSWFIDLYKVRDLLKKLYHGEEAAKARLAIVDGGWSFFGQILNNNVYTLGPSGSSGIRGRRRRTYAITPSASPRRSRSWKTTSPSHVTIPTRSMSRDS